MGRRRLFLLLLLVAGQHIALASDVATPPPPPPSAVSKEKSKPLLSSSTAALASMLSATKVGALGSARLTVKAVSAVTPYLKDPTRVFRLSTQVKIFLPLFIAASFCFVHVKLRSDFGGRELAGGGRDARDP